MLSLLQLFNDSPPDWVQRLAKMWPEIISQAEATYPSEGIWVVTDKDIWQAENVHEDPQNFFRMSEADAFHAYKENLRLVLHSHCDQCVSPSKQDMEAQIQTNVPWGILEVNQGVAGKTVWWGDQLPIAPLEGRKFCHGISDCYALVRDYYRGYGITLGLYPSSFQGDESPADVITREWRNEAFDEVSVKDLEEGDAFLISTDGQTVHHVGIYLGNDTFLHHPGSRSSFNGTSISVIEPVYRYIPYIIKALRHKEFKNVHSKTVRKIS